jgi:hypothetical protein
MYAICNHLTESINLMPELATYFINVSWVIIAQMGKEVTRYLESYESIPWILRIEVVLQILKSFSIIEAPYICN